MRKVKEETKKEIIRPTGHFSLFVRKKPSKNIKPDCMLSFKFLTKHNLEQ